MRYLRPFVLFRSSKPKIKWATSVLQRDNSLFGVGIVDRWRVKSQLAKKTMNLLALKSRCIVSEAVT